MSEVGDYKQCKICGEFDWENEHKCLPIMYFKHRDWGDIWEEIRAHIVLICLRPFAI